MKPGTLILRGLSYYWRTNAAVVLGVAAAVAVLAGALLVGDSVRGSLRDLVLQRLGNTDYVVLPTVFVREQLSEDIQTQPDFRGSFDGISPLVITQGMVSHQSRNTRAGKVHVYGVDDRFWRFHEIVATGPAGRDAFISPALALELGATPGETILVRVQRPSDVPLESLHSRKDDPGSTIRVRVQTVLAPESLGEFSLQAQQGAVRAVFLPLALLQEELEIGARVNAVLVSTQPNAVGDVDAALQHLIQSQAQLEDLGLRVRLVTAANSIVLEADGMLIDDAKAQVALETARTSALRPQRVFTYLANSIRLGEREIPYSLVTAIDLPTLGAAAPPSIVLNSWAAEELVASNGGSVTMEYYVWEEPGRLVTKTTDFRIAGIVPVSAGDRDLAPLYPGISDSATLSDWDPPFPIDLKRIRPADEAYWEKYRTTPKAFIPLEAGQQLWRSRYGALTSIRFRPVSGNLSEQVRMEFAESLRERIDPLSDIAVQAIRAQSLDASRGATNFGEYFVYFSFFIVVSALLLAALFFKLSVEYRVREVGLLRAVGVSPSLVRRLFLGEGLVLSLCGALAGVVGALVYAYVIVLALRTWWVDAVGTTALTLHIEPASLAAGAVGGIAAAVVCIRATLRSLGRISERSLLAGQLAEGIDDVRAGRKSRSAWIATSGFAALGILLLVAGTQDLIEPAAAFFGAGSSLLAAALCFIRLRLGRPNQKVVDGHGFRAVFRLGLRNVSYRPARSIVAMATIASASFILISVDAFRKDPTAAGGVGGYSLLVDLLVPLVHDPNTKEGLETLGLSDLKPGTIQPFRVRPGDDASCLNLYEPKNPRIIAPTAAFIDAGRFAFQSSLASSDAERANPWVLLRRAHSDGAIPVIADANSMTYVLHRKLGEDIVIDSGGKQIRLRLVAALDDSIFQGELVMSPDNFVRSFPTQEGYQFLLLETPEGAVDTTAAAIEEKLTDFGADAESTAARLAGFHRVENTYLSTFQMLGGLGLLLGTVGLAAVLLRNVLERRRELALLRALGYRQTHFFAMAIAENALLLFGGLFTGVVAALIAIAPVLADRGGRLPTLSLLALVLGVAAVGLVTTLIATVAALRGAMLTALRSE